MKDSKQKMMAIIDAVTFEGAIALVSTAQNALSGHSFSMVKAVDHVYDVVQLAREAQTERQSVHQ